MVYRFGCQKTVAQKAPKFGLPKTDHRIGPVGEQSEFSSYFPGLWWTIAINRIQVGATAFQ